MKKYFADFITFLRIIFSVILLFCDALSTRFFILYSLCGITDMIDGFIARKTKSESAFGSKLDTVADFVFFVSALYKLIPMMKFPMWIVVWICLVAVLKFINIFAGYIKEKRLILLHTIPNKITGFILLLLPFVMKIISIKYCMFFGCVIATFAVIHEMYCIIKK